MGQTRINWDYTKVNFAGLLSQSIRKIPELSALWTNIAPSDPGMAIVELLAHMTDVLKRYDDFTVQSLNIQSSTLRSFIDSFAKFAGQSLRPKTSSTASLTFVLKNTVTVPYLIPEGTKVKNSNNVIFETVEDLYIGSSYTGTVLATEGETVPDVALTPSDGTSFQRIKIPTDSLVYSNGSYAIRISVLEGGIQRDWVNAETLVFAKALDRVYTMQIAEDAFYILFGDNKTGLKPQTGSGITASYRVGGGERGLVDAGTITEVVTSIIKDDVESVTNPDRSYGGLEAESINSARNTIPALIKANDRAIAPDDYKILAENFDGVSVARSVALAQALYLFVVPSTAGELTEALKSALQIYFSSKKQQGYVLNILQATYKDIGMSISVNVKRGFDATTVQNEVNDNLISLLSPVEDPPELEGEDGSISLFKNDFGADLHIDSLYTIIRKTSGVKYGNITALTVDTVDVDIADISVEDFKIVRNGVINVTVINDEGDEYSSVFDPANQNQSL